MSNHAADGDMNILVFKRVGNSVDSSGSNTADQVLRSGQALNSYGASLKRSYEKTTPFWLINNIYLEHFFYKGC